MPANWTRDQVAMVSRHAERLMRQQGQPVNYNRTTLQEVMEAIEDQIDSPQSRNAISAAVTGAVTTTQPGLTLTAAQRRTLFLLALAKLLSQEAPQLIREI